MARYDTIKQAVRDAIYQNTSGAITGDVLKNKLIDIITSLGNDSNFKGILSAANKPTGAVDQKQFYLGYTSGSTITLNLSDVSLGTLTITKTTLYIVYNDDSGWHASNLFSGITDMLNAVADIGTFEGKVNAEQIALYKSCGIGLCAIDDFMGTVPNISATGYILLPDGSFTEEGSNLDIHAGDIMWVIPKNISEIVSDIEQNVVPYFNLFVPAGSVGYETMAAVSWAKVGIEVVGFPKTAIDSLNDANAYVYCCEPLYTVYSSLITNITSCEDHGVILYNLIQK